MSICATMRCTRRAKRSCHFQQRPSTQSSARWVISGRMVDSSRWWLGPLRRGSHSSRLRLATTKGSLPSRSTRAHWPAIGSISPPNVSPADERRMKGYLAGCKLSCDRRFSSLGRSQASVRLKPDPQRKAGYALTRSRTDNPRTSGSPHRARRSSGSATRSGNTHPARARACRGRGRNVPRAASAAHP
jgi:hypothetical protein